MKQKLAKTAYGSLFVLMLPGLLSLWAWRLDGSHAHLWPIPVPPAAGWYLAVIGILLMAISMHALWVKGKGLPMNAYPPTHYVDTSTYAVLPHPIYAGFICSLAGVSIGANSPAGLWVVTPTMVLATMALVVGYEGPRLRQRFVDAAKNTPFFGIPANEPTTTSTGRRLTAAVVALLPWAVLYMAFSGQATPAGAADLRFSWEYWIPLYDWAVWPYSAAYPVAIVGPLLLRTHAELRRYVVSAWLATMLGLTLMLAIPGEAPLRPLASSGITSWLLHANRQWDAAWLALPSFHVVWTLLAAYCIRRRLPASIPLGGMMTLMVSVSCLLTGSHAVADVLAGLALGMLCWHHDLVWRWLVAHAEALANSWSAVRIGPFRIISHAIWSLLAAAFGMLIVIWLAGPELIGLASIVFSVALLAAGAWGYWFEGGGRLSRPFGYYGFLFGAIAALGVLTLVDLSAAQRLMAAFACGAPVAQAIGRLRCLVQGCCHGKPSITVAGIRVFHPESRVTALGHLQGIPIHPTQLYSIAGNVVISLCLWRLWHIGATTTLICGLYLVFSSLARFAEEQYRGEPQTPKIFELASYQWFAVAMFILGILVSMADGEVAHANSAMTFSGIATALVAGSVAALFMSVDFPNSRWRFSRLTVGEPTAHTNNGR